MNRHKLLAACVPALLAATATATAVGAEGYQIGRAGFGAFIVPVPLSVQADRGLEPGEGGLVLRVRPGSTADTLGVQPGDVVTSINDNPIANRHDVRDVVRSVSPGDAAQVTLVRDDGQAQQVDGEFLNRQPRPAPGSWMNWPGLAGLAGLLGGGAAGAGASGTPGVQQPWAGAWRDPDQVVQEQRKELLAERDQLRAAESDLATARAALPADDGSAWFMHVDISAPMGEP